MDQHPASFSRPARRYITGLNNSGTSIITGYPAFNFHVQCGITYSRLYSADTLPANLDGNEDITKYLSDDPDRHKGSFANPSVALPGGVNFIQAELQPLGVFPWHRTLSLDFVTVLFGEIELEVEAPNDEGIQKVLLRAGDSVVQRATIHRWVNPSQEHPTGFVVTTVSTVSNEKSHADLAAKDPSVIP